MSEMHNSASDRRAACEADANVGGALRTAFSHSRLKGGRMGSGHTSEPLTIQFVLGAIRRWWMVALPCGVLLAAVVPGSSIGSISRLIRRRPGCGSASTRRISPFRCGRTRGSFWRRSWS